MVSSALINVKNLTDITQNVSPLILPRETRTRFNLHFSLSLESGEIIDSNFDKAPVSFTIGDGNLLPEFEAVISDQLPGEPQTYILEPAQAFGERKEENIHTYPIYQFPGDLALTEGMMLSFSDQKGNEQAGMIKTVEKSTVIVDFNHPLSGKRIVFKVQVLNRQQESNTND